MLIYVVLKIRETSHRSGLHLAKYEIHSWHVKHTLNIGDEDH